MSENIFIASGKEFDRDWLLDTIALNADAYAQNRLRLQPEKRNMWGKVKQSAFDVEGFHTALSDVTKAIAEGKLTRDAGNVYTHSDGIVWDDPSHRAALDLVNQSISAISSVEKPKYSNTRLLDRFNNKFYGGNFKGSESDYEMWKNGSKGINDIKALLDEEISDIQNNDLDYTGSAYKNKDEYLAKLQQLRTNLDNEVSESDLADWVALGGDGDFFRAVTNLKQPKKTIELENAERRQVAIELALREDPSLTREDAEAAYDSMILSRKKERELQNLKDTEDSDWDTYAANTFTSTANSKWSLNNYNSGKARGDKFWLDFTGEGSNLDTKGFISTHKNDVNRVLNNFKQGIINTGKNIDKGITEDELLMVLLHYDIIKNPNNYIKAPDDSYIIKSSIKSDGTAYRYDPKKRTLYKYHATENTAGLNKYYHDEWLKNRYKSNTRYKFRNGGAVEKLRVLKALNGADIIKMAEDNALKTKKEVEAKAKAEGKTYDLYRAAKRKVQKDGEFDLDTTTSLRLAGAASDIASAVAAFAPGYGTAVSGVLSLGGIGADLAADATDDSVTGWDMTKNLVVNLGIGLAGLIPVIGTSGKFAKAAKTVAKLAPTLLAIGSTVAGYDQASNTIKKLVNNKDVTVEEWMLLGRWIASAAGTTRAGAQALKTQALRASANKTITEGETVKIKTTKGEVPLNAELKNLLTSAKSPEEANGLLKTWFGDDAGNVKYDKSLLWKFWKGRQTSSELPITTTNETTTTYDLNTVPDLFGRRGLTKWGLSSDIDMLTGNGGLFGISKWRLSLPSSFNPYIRLKGTETIVKPVALTAPTQTSTAQVASENPITFSTTQLNLQRTGTISTLPEINSVAKITLELRKQKISVDNLENLKLFKEHAVKHNLDLRGISKERWLGLKNYWKFKQGGSINPLKELRTNFTTDNSNSSTELSKFLHGGKPSGVQLSAGTTWLNDIFNVYKQDLLDKLSKNGSAAMDDINSMQDRHHKMYTDALAAGNWQDKAFTYGGDDTSIRDYQTAYDDPTKYGYNSKDNLDAIRQAYNKGRYTTTGTRTSGDGLEHSFKPDNLYSSITDDRRILGRQDDWNENSEAFKNYQGELNQLGYEMYLDPNTKYYKLRPLDKSEKDKDNASLKPGMKGDDGGTPAEEESTDLSKYGDILTKITPELLSNYRFLKNLINNKKVKDLALKKEAVLLSPIHKHLNVYGDYQSKVLGEKLSADVMSKADRYAESTADLQAAALAKLEGLRQANDLITKGHTADNAAIKQSIKEAKAVDDAVLDYNHKVGDENWSRLIAKHNADIDALMGYNSANTTNWNNYLSEHELRARINLNDLKQRQLALYKQRMSDYIEDAMKNDPEYIKMYNEYINPNTSAQRLKELLTEIANWLKTRMQEITPYVRRMTANYILGKNLDEVFELPASLFRATAAERRTQAAARGGRLTVDSSRMKYRADDLRELRKQIKHNIDTNRHALDNLSKATLLELKKMMGI